MKVCLVFICVLMFSFAKAQDDLNYVSTDDVKSNYSFQDKLYTGGNFGFRTSNGLIFFEISPMLGYKINERLSAGISAKYFYWGALNNSNPFVSYKYYGGGIFSRYAITESIIAAAEYELLNVEDLNPNNLSYGKRTFANVLLLGAGYNNTIANNINLQFYLLYDVIDDANSPYRYNYLFGPNGIPVIYRIGFSIGI